MAAEALEQSVLESKDREQLMAIAQALGVKSVSRAKKAELIDKILEQTAPPVETKRPARTEKQAPKEAAAPKEVPAAKAEPRVVIGIDPGFTAAEADCGEAGYLWPCYLRALILTTPVRMRLQLFAVKSHTSPASESR